MTSFLDIVGRQLLIELERTAASFLDTKPHGIGQGADTSHVSDLTNDRYEADVHIQRSTLGHFTAPDRRADNPRMR
jgi:hypothetical protein